MDILLSVCRIMVIVPISKGRLILTGEFKSSAIVCDRRDIIPKNQEESPSSIDHEADR